MRLRNPVSWRNRVSTNRWGGTRATRRVLSPELTILDHFAGQALIALLTDQVAPKALNSPFLVSGEREPNAIAHSAYEYAGAMMMERSKRLQNAATAEIRPPQKG